MESNYNLEERCEKFGEDVIKLCKSIAYDTITIVLIK